MGEEAGLGVLTAVELDSVWVDEARGFTPWLLEHDHLLAEAVGLDLTLSRAEQAVGDFSLDLLGEDAEGGTVIVENQLRESDHRHLGQLLTYWAGTSAATIIWVASSFRPEHLAVVNRLNEATPEGTRFFAVQVQAWVIDESRPAVRLEVLAKPSDWGKQTQRRAQRARSDVQASLRGELWAWLLDELPEEVRDETAEVVRTDAWSEGGWLALATPSGPGDVGFGVGGLGNRVWSALFVDATRAPVLDASLGGLQQECADLPDLWVETSGERAFVTAYRPGRLTTRRRWPEYRDWFAGSQHSLRAAALAVDLRGRLPQATDTTGVDL